MTSNRKLPKPEISPLFFFSIAVHLYFGLSAWLKNLLLAAALHEIGHAVLLCYFRIPIQRIRLTSLGAVMSVGPIGYREELICAAAGPVVNALLAFAFLHRSPLFGLCNVSLLAFNLLPIFPLDGGRVLRAVLFRQFDPVRAERLETGIAIIASGAVMLASLLIGWYVTKNLYPVFVAALVLLRPIFADRKDKLRQAPCAFGKNR